MVQPCGGGAAGGLGQAPHRAKGEGFERENPLVSKGMNHTWGWERQLRSAEQKGKGGFDYKRIHKVITRRETRHLGKGRVAGRGESNRGFNFHVFFFLRPQSRDHAGDAVPRHCSATRRLLRNELHRPALPTNISLGDKSSPSSQAPRLGAASSDQAERILIKVACRYKQRQTVVCTALIPPRGADLCSVFLNRQSNEKDLHGKAAVDISQG